MAQKPPSSAPKRYAIITPYYKESRDVLERCMASVKAQTIKADHFLVADGHPQAWLDDIEVRHLKLDKPHGDYGNTPRGVGALLAVAEQYDGIALLDADNWLASDHIEKCLAAAMRVYGEVENCDYVIAKRWFRRADGSDMALGEEPDHVDTNCFFFLKGAFDVLRYWGTMPKMLSQVADRMFRHMLSAKKLRAAHVESRTVNYLALWNTYYEQLGETPPPDAKAMLAMTPVFDWHDSLSARENVIKNRLVGFGLIFKRPKPG